MFNPVERKAVLSLACILAFRMLGLFIIIPVFSPYLQSLDNSTPLLIGFAMGIYGLTQAIFQLPFGILSDYMGRKKVITLGLLLFLLGSVVAGSSQNILLVILGRALQGTGAISGATMALLSDLTSEESRTKAMAVMGMSIGSAFMLAFILGPTLNTIISVQNIFYVVAGLVVPILAILWLVTPTPSLETHVNVSSNMILPENLRSLFNAVKTTKVSKDIYKLIKILSFSVFTLHGILMANFVAIPIIFRHLGLTSQQQAWIYITVFVLAVLVMLPILIVAEKKQQQKKAILFSVLILILAETILWLLNGKFWGIIAGLILFFVGFNILEASLPSLISKVAPKNNKGAVMGVYSTAQFLGPMLGGALAGVLFNYFSLVSVFLLGMIWAVFWLLIIYFNLNRGMKWQEVLIK